MPKIPLLVISILILSSCTISDDMVKETGRAATSVMIGKAVMSNATKDADIAESIKEMSPEQTNAIVSIHKNNRYKGFIEGFLLALVLSFLVKGIGFVVSRWKPKMIEAKFK